MIFGNRMNNKNNLIQFYFQSPCTLTARRALGSFIISIFKREKRPLEAMSIIFCSDEYLLSLNRQFLQHDYYTDIISFPLSEPGKALIAEIYVSIERVRENARNAHVSFRKELHRVIFHGILHFCGYKDKSPMDIKKMRATEDRYLKAYFQQET